jgi:hypothetical protein
MFNHGATLTNVFGWNIGDSANVFRQAAGNPAAIEAYRKFLRGASLDEGPLDQSSSSEVSRLLAALQHKMRTLPQKVASFQQRNGDMNRIKARLESIQKHIGAGELANAFNEIKDLEPILEVP